MSKSLSGFHYEQIVARDKAQNIPKMQAEEVFITLQGGPVRYRYDGKEPDVFTGHILYDGMSLRLTSIGQIEKFSFIGIRDQAGVLSLTYEKE